MFSRFFKTLEEHDIFISYSRSDGERYCKGVYDAIRQKGFSCFYDGLGTEADPLPPQTLLHRIRHCKTFVLVGSPGAIIRPENITLEVTAFAEANRTERIIPISFSTKADTDPWSNVSWYQHVQGKPREYEDATTLVTGKPSANIIDEIEKRSDYIKQRDRLRLERARLLRNGVAIICGLFLAGAVASLFAAGALLEAFKQRNNAASARLDADRSIANSKNEAAQAEEKAREDIKRAENYAQSKISAASVLTEQAEQKRITAETNTREAESQRVRAEAEANKLQTIAQSRSLANLSQLILQRHPAELPRSVLLAVDALKKYPTVEADAALRESLGLLPRLRSSETYGRNIKQTALSPDGRHFATISFDNMLSIYKLGSQTPIKEIPCKGELVAISNDGTHAAVNYLDEIKVIDLTNSRSRTIKKENTRVFKLALSPGGKYVAAIVDDGQVDFLPNKAYLMDAEDGRIIRSLGEDLNMSFVAIGFGPTGNLALGGGRSLFEGRDAGRVLVWTLSAKLATGENAQKLTDEDFLNPIDAYIDEDIRVVSPGADDALVATDKSVWRRTGIRKYEQIARVPVVANSEEARDEYRAESIAFNRENTRLTVARPRRIYVPDSRPPKPTTEPTLARPTNGYYLNTRLLEVWDTEGYREAVSASYDFSAISSSNLVFEPGSERINTLTWGRSEVRTLRVSGDALVVELEASISPPVNRVFAISPDVSHIASGGATVVQLLDIWNRKTFSAPYAADINRPNSVTLGSGGRFFVLVSNVEPVKDPEDDEPAHEAIMNAGAVVVVYRRERDAYGIWKRFRLNKTPKFVALTPDGGLLATMNLNETIQVWDVVHGRDVTPESLRSLERAQYLQMSPDGRFLGVIDVSPPNTSRLVKVWRLADGVELHSVSDAKMKLFHSFSGNGRYIFGTGVDKTNRLIDLSTGQVKRLLEGVEVLSAVFSRDERYVGIGDDLGVLRVYRTDDLENEVARLQHESSIADMAFSDDNRLLVTSSARFHKSYVDAKGNPMWNLLSQTRAEEFSGDQRLRVWYLRREDLITEARKRVAALPAYARN